MKYGNHPMKATLSPWSHTERELHVWNEDFGAKLGEAVHLAEDDAPLSPTSTQNTGHRS